MGNLSNFLDTGHMLYYAKVYGLIRDELRYILDPKDVYGPNFPGETFRVLKKYWGILSTIHFRSFLHQSL